MTIYITNANSFFFDTKEDYLAYRADWKLRANTQHLTGADFLIHALITGKDLHRTFSACKSCARPYQTLADLLYWASPAYCVNQRLKLSIL